MDNKLRLYYTYFIPITLLQILTSVLMMSFYSVDDYGQFTLYLTSVNFFFFLTLGLQNGYTIMVRDKVLDVKYTAIISKIISQCILAILIVSLPILVILDIEYYWKCAFLSGLINVIYIFHKSVFRVNIQIHALNILTLLFRLIFLVDIIYYLLRPEITSVIFLDTVLRLTLVCCSTIIISVMYKVNEQTTTKELIEILKEITKIGLPIMAGNWLISIYIIFDKTFLASDSHLLGLYSFSITSVLLLRVLLVPLSELLFVTLNKDEKKELINARLKSIWFTVNIFVLIAIVGAYILIDYIGIFSQYIEALSSLLILLNILPLSVALDTYIYNIQRRKNGTKFLILSAISALVCFIIIFLYTSVFILDLVTYSFIIYFTYLLVYIIFVSNIISFRSTIFLALKHICSLIVFCGLIFILLK